MTDLHKRPWFRTAALGVVAAALVVGCGKKEEPKPAAPAAEGEAAGTPQPVLGGRKMQEALRELREQWKQTDQGGQIGRAHV